MSSRMQLAVAVALGLISLNCGRDKANQDLIVVQSSQAIETCPDSSITWDDPTPSSVCAGPWEYSTQCHVTGPHPSCGTPTYDQCDDYGTCRHASFGYSLYPDYYAVSGETLSTTGEPYEDCWCPGLQCRNGCCEPLRCETRYRFPLASQIAQQALDSARAIILTLNLPEPHRTTALDSCYTQWLDTPPWYMSIFATCSRVPYPNYGTGPVCGVIGHHDCGPPHYPSCEHLAPASECPDNPHYSTPGLSLDALRDRVGPLLATDPASRCMTCQAMPMSTAQQVRDKHDCLTAQIAALPAIPTTRLSQAAKDALTVQLVSNLKALFEIKGDLLDEPRQRATLSLYTSSPRSKYDCSGWAAPSVPASCAGPPDDQGLTPLDRLKGEMDRCYRLSVVNVSQPLFSENANQCADAAIAISPLSLDTCEGQTYRNAYGEFMYSVLDKAARSIRVDETGRLRNDDLQSHLALVGHWYDRARDNLYPLEQDPDPAQLWGLVSRMLASLSRVASQRTVSAVSQMLPDGGVPLQDSINSGLEADLSILRAAFTTYPLTGAPPLTRAPLLMVLHDAFQGMYERISDVAPLHDLGCLYQQPSCRDSGTVTEVSELWRLLGSIHDSTTLNAALSAATHTRTPWKDAFRDISNQHPFFRNAVVDAQALPAYDPRYIFDDRAPEQRIEIPLESWTTPARQLIRMLRDGMGRSGSYTQSGQFDSAPRNVLHFGISQRFRNSLRQLVQDRTTDLDRRVNEFVLNQRQYVSDLLAQLRNERDRTSVRDRLDEQVQQFNDLSDQLAALRNDAEVEQARYSDMLGTLNAAMTDEVSRRLVIDGRDPFRANVSARDSAFDGRPRVQSIPELAVQRDGLWPMVATRGDVLNIDVSGQWAPTCSLLDAELVVPYGGGQRDRIRLPSGNFTTGPEGFLITWDHQHAVARSNQSVHQAGHYTQDGDEGRRTSCAGGKVSRDGSVPPELRDHAQDNYNYEDRCTTEDGYSVSTNTQWSAHFTTGLRLSNTPFPDLPAGSLLVLVTAQTANPTFLDIKDVHLVQAPHSSLLIPQNSNVYFVVNDLACGRDDLPSLSVEIRHLHAVGEVAGTLMQAMSIVYERLKNRTEELVPGGFVSGSELTALRGEADTSLRRECELLGGVCDVDNYPPELTGVFRTFINKELAQLERRVRIRDVEKNLRLRTMELDALRRDLELSGSEGRLLSLLITLNLRNVDGTTLRNETKALANVVTSHLYPVVALRYPEVFAALHSDADARRYLDSLVNVDWTSPIFNLADTTRRAVQKIDDKLAAQQSIPPGPDRVSEVAISFLKPGRTSDNNFVKVDEARARWLWSNLLETDNALFTLPIQPQDFYTSGSAAGLLGCYQSVPIIRSMALFMAWRSHGSGLRSALDGESRILNGEVWQAHDMEANSALSFPTEDGIKVYTMDKEAYAWQRGDLRILFGYGYEAIQSAKDWELPAYADVSGLGTANGLTPGTIFTQNLLALRNISSQPLQNADELIAVFQVETRGAARPVQLPPVCQ